MSNIGTAFVTIVSGLMQRINSQHSLGTAAENCILP